MFLFVSVGVQCVNISLSSGV